MGRENAGLTSGWLNNSNKRRTVKPMLMLAAAAGLMQVSAAYADNIYFTGSTNSDYGTATNWTNRNAAGTQRVPIAGDTAAVDNGGTATITSGTFTASEVWVGNNVSDDGGAGGLGTGFGNLYQSGGTLTASNWLDIGRFDSVGTFDVSGGVVQQNNTADAVQMFGTTTVDTAIFNVHGNAQVTTGGIVEVGVRNSGNAHLLLSENATFTSNNFLIIGHNTSNGTFDMTGGTLVANSSLAVARSATNSTTTGGGAIGTFNMSGGTITKNGTNQIRIGDSQGSNTLAAATGTWNLSGGVVNSAGELWLGQDAKGVGILNMSGGTINQTNWLAIGRTGGSGTLNMSGGVFNKTSSGAVATGGHGFTGNNVTFAGINDSVTINGGTFNNLNSLTILGESSTSTWNQVSGASHLGVVLLGWNNNVVGNVNISGGTFGAKQFVIGMDTAQANTITGTTSNVNFNGGTLLAEAGAATNFMRHLTSAKILSGGATIDTNSQNITIDQPLLTGASPDGGLTKLSLGALTLSGVNTYTGNTNVNAGSINLTGSLASSVNVAAAAGFGGTSATAITGTVAGGLTFNGTSSSLSTLLVNPNGTQFLTINGSVSETGGINSVLVSPTLTVPTAGTPLVVLYAKGNFAGGAADVANFVPGVRGTLSIVNDPSSIGQDLVLTASSPTASLIWKGTDSTHPTFWDVQTTVNWLNTGTNGLDKFYAGDTVTFDNTASNFNVAVQGVAVTPAAVIFNNSAANTYTLSGGAISDGPGATTMSITGGGTVIVTNANAFTGATTITSGTLQLGDGTSGHDGTVAGAIVDNSALVFNRNSTATQSGVISGTGTVAVTGTGTQVLTGTHTYTGGTTVSAGSTLQIGSGAGSGVNGSLATPTISNSGAVVFNQNGTNTYAGVISGTGSVTALNGTQILTGNQTYSGNTVINSAANLQIGAATTTGALNPSSAILDSGVLIFNRSNNATQGTDFGVVTGTGGLNQAGAGVLTLNQLNTNTGLIRVQNGTLALTSTGGLGIGSVAGSGGRLIIGEVANVPAVMTIDSGAVVNLWGTPAVIIGGNNSGAATDKGTLIMNGGTLLSQGEFYVGNGAANVAEYDMNGGSVTINNWLAIGRNGANGLINMTGGTINKPTGSGGNISFNGVTNGTFTNSATFIQSGGLFTAPSSTALMSEIAGTTSTWALSNAAVAGVSALRVGEQGTGIITQAGTSSMSSFYATVGPNASSTGSWTISDSATGVLTERLYLGENGKGTVTVGGTAASLSLDNMWVGRESGSTATLNLNTGGTITMNYAFRGSSPTVALNFGGGTLKANSDQADYMSNFNAGDAHLLAGGLTIDSNGHNIGLSTPFSGVGQLTKTGLGTVTYSGATTHTGTTTVAAGTLKMSHVIYSNNVHASDIAAYYKFDSAGGLLNDSSGHGNNLLDAGAGTGAAATFSSISAPPGKAGSLALPNNNADYLSSQTADFSAPANFPIGNSSYTLGGWVNVDGQTTHDNGLIGWGLYGTTVGGRDTLALRTGSPGGVRNSSINNYWWNADLERNVLGHTNMSGLWHYMAVSYNNVTDSRTLYFDGVAIGSDSPGINAVGSANFAVGRTSPTEFFSGNMSEVFVANSALSQADIVNAMNNGITIAATTADGSLSAASLLGVSTGATLDLNGTSQSVAGITDVSGAGGSITNTFAGSSVLTNAPATAQTFSGVISDGTGTVALTHSTGSQTLSGVNTYTGDTNVNGGTLTVAPAGAIASVNVNVAAAGVLAANGNTNAGLSTSTVLTDNGVATIAAATSGVSSVTVASVTLGTTGSLSMTDSGNHANRKVLVTGALTLAGASDAWGGKLDLQGNDLIVHNGNLANITNQIKQGYAGGGFTGAAGITTSSPAADTLHTLGSASSLVGTYDGVSVIGTDVFVKYTYYGDADLNGIVNGNDYSQIDNAFSSNTGSGWQNGDFNYDGKIDGSDYSLIDNAFNRQSGSLAASSASMVASSASEVAGSAGAAVPEPTSLGLFGLGAVSLLGRRRRKAK